MAVRIAASLLSLLLLAPVVAAETYSFQEPASLDHREQWGIRIEPGATVLGAMSLDGSGGWAVAGGLEVGLSRGLSFSGHEISGRARLLHTRDGAGLMAMAGYRVYAGLEHWKSFADLDVVAPLSPAPAAGARLGLGLMYDPSRRLGLSLSGGAFAALGRGTITGFDAALGLQIRFD